MTKKMTDSSRSFKVVSSSFGTVPENGRYIGREPKDAAPKAARVLFRREDLKRKTGSRNNIVELEMVEITRSPRVRAKLERYTYKVTRSLIPEGDRKAQVRNGVSFTPKYTYKCVSIQDAAYTGTHVVGGEGEAGSTGYNGMYTA